MLFARRALQSLDRGTRRLGHHARDVARRADRVAQRGMMVYNATQHLLPDNVRDHAKKGLSTYNQIRQRAIEGDRAIQSLRP